MLAQKKSMGVFVFSGDSNMFFSDANTLWDSYCLSCTSSYIGLNRTADILYCWL